VAFVQVVDEKVVIQFHNDSVYAQRYQIKPQVFQELRSNPKLPSEARDLLSRARLINQRLSALSRLITALCNQQLEYLQSGDMRRLKPLAQAELARQMGEHPSTISRLIRGKVIETPWGKFPILFLCQSKTDVVARLIAMFPKLTDQEVVSRLRDEFDCHIARRTVAYHRGKRLRRNKRHKTTGKNDEQKNAGQNGVEQSNAEQSNAVTT
jgi:DNA-directed RNA polymerase specialized sigma54-like protein